MNENYVIAPSSDLKLLKVPIQIDELNQIDFATFQDQYNYFNSLPNKIEFDKFTYIRENSTIRVEAQLDDIIEYNYVMYRNTAFSNKWFYAFIDNMTYRSDSMTDISIREDSFQTWLLYLTFKPSFIERKHVTDDTIGKNTIPEGLEHGEYIVNDYVRGRNFDGCIIVGATLDFNNISGNKYTNINGNSVGHVYSGIRYYVFTSVSTLNNLLKDVANKGQSNGIVNIFMGTNDFCNLVTGDGINYPYIQDDDSMTAQQYLQQIRKDWTVVVLGGTSILPPSKPTTINGYTPKNNKLLTSEYCYLLADNNHGGLAQYKYELFSSTNCDFYFYGTVTPGMSIRLIPKNYNSQTECFNEGLTLGKLPVCAWNTDTYTNWLTQNGVNIGNIRLNAKQKGFINAGISFGTGVIATALGSPIGAMGIFNGFTDIMETMQETYSHSLVAPQSEGNTNSGDVTYSMGLNTVTLYRMSIKYEYAEIIDKFFDMYGYKVNILETPALHTRTYWNYIKTRGLNVLADIPQKSLQNIKNMFDNGITIWHDPTKFLDYTQNNTIISS